MLENHEIFSSYFSENDSEHTVPSDSIAQQVERGTGVPEGASSNPARVNSFSVNVSSVRKS